MAKAAIFDKDGVIIHTTALYFERWKRTFAKYNKELTLDFHNKELSGRKARDSIRKHLDPSISEENLTKLLQEQFNFTMDQFEKYVKPVLGVIEFLEKLNRQKIPTALATSSRKTISDYVLKNLDIKKYFQSIITGDDVSKAKPDPEIYLKSAQNLHINPSECVVFEDSYSGVEAAKKAGMKVVLVMTSHTKKEIPNVDLAIKDFSKINISDIRSL